MLHTDHTGSFSEQQKPLTPFIIFMFVWAHACRGRECEAPRLSLSRFHQHNTTVCALSHFSSFSYFVPITVFTTKKVFFFFTHLHPFVGPGPPLCGRARRCRGRFYKAGLSGDEGFSFFTVSLCRKLLYEGEGCRGNKGMFKWLWFVYLIGYFLWNYGFL